MIEPLKPTVVVAIGCVAALPACRDAPQKPHQARADHLERPTRFDDMSPPPPPEPARELPPDPLSARDNARRIVEFAIDDVATSAHATHLADNPTDEREAKRHGRRVGVFERQGDELVLRMRNASGPVFARVPAEPEVDGVACWGERWRPPWAPEVSSGPGGGLDARSRMRWWRFDATDDGPPALVRFDPAGVALWRADGEGCHRGESLLGLTRGAASVAELMDAGPWTGGEDPARDGELETGESATLDLPGPGELSVEQGRVRLSRGEDVLAEWNPIGEEQPADCSRARWAVYSTDDVATVYVEATFSDSPWCDQSWSRREIHRTLLRDGERRFDARELEWGEGYSGGGSRQFELEIPMGDGTLLVESRESSEYDESGGEEYLDCSGWADDLRVDEPATAFETEKSEARWTWRSDEMRRKVGKVSVETTSAYCTTAP